MRLHSLSAGFLRAKPAHVLALAGVLILLIAWVDWRILTDASVGFLYVFPIALAAPLLTRWQIGVLALLCTVLREQFSSLPRAPELLPRSFLVILAFAGTGLFIRESARMRDLVIQNQVRLRQQAEEQSRMLIESSLAAIVSVDAEGKVVLANEAAHHLFAAADQTLTGRALEDLLPGANVFPSFAAGQGSRRMVECTARRLDGETFFAQAWISTYASQGGARATAIIFNASDELRDREQSRLRQLLMSSRVMMGAAWHEVRNYCAAIGVLQASLARNPELAATRQVSALGTLVEGLRRLVSSELRSEGGDHLEEVDLHAVLSELRIIIEPSFQEIGAAITWSVPDSLPKVMADSSGLLQTFLNVTQNARRALAQVGERRMAVTCSARDRRVSVEIHNNGPRIADPSRLFEPFQKGADVTGLGLYISRAIVRAFHGDLRYLPTQEGCSFLVELLAAGAKPQG
ncbi:MAG TPA: ATP-binding protein [Bryobacteraceae bacterium]|nr:ATP-binding protein [Bryobacteraceae bacterium]